MIDETKKIILNFKEKIWLNQHGGLTEEDVFLDEQGLKYVLMRDGRGGDVRVYLPDYRGY